MILDNRHTQLSADGDELGEPRPLDEAFDTEIRRVHAENQGRLIAHGGGVVGGARAIGGAHLTQDGARLTHDIGHPKATADLDQLATRHDHLPSRRERRERKQRGRRVVVHDNAALGSRQQGNETVGVDVALAALADREVVLEIGVTTSNRRDAFNRGCAQRRAAQLV